MRNEDLKVHSTKLPCTASSDRMADGESRLWPICLFSSQSSRFPRCAHLNPIPWLGFLQDALAGKELSCPKRGIERRCSPVRLQTPDFQPESVEDSLTLNSSSWVSSKTLSADQSADDNLSIRTSLPSTHPPTEQPEELSEDAQKQDSEDSATEDKPSVEPLQVLPKQLPKRKATCLRCSKVMLGSYGTLHVSLNHLKLPCFQCQSCGYRSNYWSKQQIIRHIQNAHQIRKPMPSIHFQDLRTDETRAAMKEEMEACLPRKKKKLASSPLDPLHDNGSAFSDQ